VLGRHSPPPRTPLNSIVVPLSADEAITLKSHFHDCAFPFPLSANFTLLSSHAQHLIIYTQSSSFYARVSDISIPPFSHDFVHNSSPHNVHHIGAGPFSSEQPTRSFPLSHLVFSHFLPRTGHTPSSLRVRNSQHLTPVHPLFKAHRPPGLPHFYCPL